jgi:hypothetical protein
MYIYIYAYFCITYTSSDMIYSPVGGRILLRIMMRKISGFCSLILLLGQTILMALPLCHKREYIGSSKNIKITDDYGG